MNLIRRFQLWRAQHQKLFYVLLKYDDGDTWRPGPMTHFAAEVLITYRLWPERNRRVISARIVRP